MLTRLLLCSFLIYSSICASADSRWNNYLKARGQTSYDESEYRAFVDEHIDEYVADVYSDVEQVVRQILENYNPKEYWFIDIGTGPQPIAVYLRNMHDIGASHLPLSGFCDRTCEERQRAWIMNAKSYEDYYLRLPAYLELLRDHFARFIPGNFGERKKVLIYDSTQTGTTISNAVRRIRDYLKLTNPEVLVEGLALGHPNASFEKLNEEINVFSLRGTTLGSYLFNRVFQEYAETTRFEPGIEKSSNILRNPKGIILNRLMRKMMADHGVKLSELPCDEMFHL